MPIGLQGFQRENTLGCRFQPKPKVSIQCLNCSKDFLVQPWDAKRGRKFCSEKCRSSYNASKDRHWNWQGGISTKWDMLHNSSEYKEWRMAIYKRDHFKCQECGVGQSKKNKLHAHHIFTKKEFPDFVLELGNGITLCSICHQEIHRGRHG